MSEFENCYWTSSDGLTLHYREYAPNDGAGAVGLPVVCLHGLTRNARDFEALAPYLAEAGRRVLCPDMRGRGDSEYARDSASYTPIQYIDDLRVLLQELNIDRFVVIGTSMGGLMAMIMALMATGDETMPSIAGCALNDVGPALELEGLDRIRGYLGQGKSYPTWVHAARGLEEAEADVFPDRPLDFWIGLAKQRMAVSTGGRIVSDYDMKIAEPFENFDPDTQPDLWPAFEALSGAPLLLLHGARSDLLSAATVAKMQARIPDAEALTLPDTGHAPTLDEPESRAAIDRLLARAG